MLHGVYLAVQRTRCTWMLRSNWVYSFWSQYDLGAPAQRRALLVTRNVLDVLDVLKMTNTPPSSPLNSSIHDTASDPYNLQHHHQTRHHPQVPTTPPTFYSNGKIKLMKSNSSPMTSGAGDLPPLVGVPHDRPQSNHRRSPDSGSIPTSCRMEARESDSPVNCGVSSPLRRRRLKYMVRQSSDSELFLNSNICPGHLRVTSSTNEAVILFPHPPDQSPHSQNSSDSNSPRSHRTNSGNPSRAGSTRHSRSLEASPLIVRRTLGGVTVRRSSCEPDYRASSPPPGSDHNRRLRPVSFGCVTDALRQVSGTTDPSLRGAGSPFLAQRLRGGMLQSPSRPDTPVNDALSVQELWKLYQLPTSSGERGEGEGHDRCSIGSEDCSVPLEEASLPRRMLRRESGSNHSQRRSNCTTPSDYKTSDAHHHASHAYDEPCANHVIDDDTGQNPNALYDIQERRESILSLEAVHEIARRFANTSLERTSDKETGTSDGEDNDSKKIDADPRTMEQKVPDYRKKPLPRDTRVANWLKGIPDPTEKTTSTNVGERILPDII